jgi:hypothetical protein
VVNARYGRDEDAESMLENESYKKCEESEERRAKIIS